MSCSIDSVRIHSSAIEPDTRAVRFRSAISYRHPSAGLRFSLKNRQVQRPDSIEATKWDLILHEYDTVRSELLYAIAAQHTIMTYTLAATAAIFTGLLATWSKIDIRVTILSLAPLFLMFAWFVWFGELVRMARAARFSWEMEKMINFKVRSESGGLLQVGRDASGLSQNDVLHWEGWVRGDNKWHMNLHLGPSYALSSALLIGTAVISMTLSIVFAATLGELSIGIRFLAAGAALLSAAIIVYAGYSIRVNPLIRRGMADNR